MKKLLYATTFALAFVSLVPVAQAEQFPEVSKVPHITESGANPNYVRTPRANYHFTVHVVGRSLSQLSIAAPEELRLSKAIEVTDQSGKKLPATVSLEGQKAIISFAQPVSPATSLRVNMKQIKTPFLRHRNVWLFPVSSRLEGLSAEIPLGLVQIQPRPNPR